MKYRVTPRGWVVFSFLGFLILWGLFSLISGLSSEEPSVDNNDTIVETDDVDVTEDPVEETSEESVEDESTDEIKDDENEETSEEVNEDDEPENVTEEPTNEVDIIEIDLQKRSEILFDANISELKEEYFELLNEWLEILNMNPELNLVVEGHINGYPYYDDGPYGLGIAEKRATIVIDYFVNQGIDASRLILENKGSTDQVTTSDDVEEHYLNRRAVIYFNTKTTN